ncbi:hypothetical protein ElyMa_004756000 [Elysia marginata]|uniref:Uncharacterized protein n=1 Tax=Elysia marginata TaxID=1093978 RepID=A0AAV4IFW9_9GAST|nr:hypothetical protein ElyMa_004756000 [Elysia marginata]
MLSALSIDEVSRLWKVFTTKTPFQQCRLKDTNRVVVDLTDAGTNQLLTLQAWADRAKEMEPNSTPRVKTLTKDTSKALHWSCKCLIDICKHLLQTTEAYRHQSHELQRLFH